MGKESLIQEKSFEFALTIINFYRELASEKEYVLSRQLLRSGTNIGANVAEAGAAQSRPDFLSKMSIASKESRETKYWLLLLKESNLVQTNVSNELRQIEEIIKILTSIVKTTSETK